MTDEVCLTGQKTLLSFQIPLFCIHHKDLNQDKHFFHKTHTHLQFFTSYIKMKYLYINYQLLCTDYYLFIKY